MTGEYGEWSRTFHFNVFKYIFSLLLQDDVQHCRAAKSVCLAAWPGTPHDFPRLALW